MEDVIITISGGADAAVEFTTQGRMHTHGGKTILLYAESDLSGVEGTFTRIEMDKSEVSLHRYGSSETFMHFQRNMPSMTRVETPFGEGVLNVYTHDLRFSGGEEGGRLDLRYTLEIDGHTSENALWLNYRPAQC